MPTDAEMTAATAAERTTSVSRQVEVRVPSVKQARFTIYQADGNGALPAGSICVDVTADGGGFAVNLTEAEILAGLQAAGIASPQARIDGVKRAMVNLLYLAAQKAGA